MKTVHFGKPHIRLEIAGSTNTYARQLIEANRPSEGMVITSAFQYSGRGQGSHVWESETGKNLLCSYVFYPAIQAGRIFILNKMIACAVHQCLVKLTGMESLKIKWPNDILIQDKKMAGILVETGIKGNAVSHCIAGIGINVNQEVFRTHHPEAVSIKLLTHKHTELDIVLGMLNKSMSYWNDALYSEPQHVVDYYAQHLYLTGEVAEFFLRNNRVTGIISGVDDDGHLLFKTGQEELLKLKHGEIQYIF